MESTNNNNQLMFLSEFKELRKEISAVKKRIIQLEESNEKQQERLDILERENHALKTQLNHVNGNKAGESALKRKRTEKNQDNKEEPESKPSSSTSAGKKKTKAQNHDEEPVVVSRFDNGDSFDSLSDDLLHKIVEFDGNCYEKFGLINKRCKNIYDVKEYKLEKKTCVYGYGTLDMMLQHYLRREREGGVVDIARYSIVISVIWYNRLDAIDWIIQLGDNALLQCLCYNVAYYGKINILTRVFCKCNLTMLDVLLNNDTDLCYEAANGGKLETLKWLRKYNAKLGVRAFTIAEFKRHDEIVQYLRNEGYPETFEDTDSDDDY